MEAVNTNCGVSFFKEKYMCIIDRTYARLVDELTNGTNRNITGLVYDIIEDSGTSDDFYISTSDLTVIIENAFNQVGGRPEDPAWIAKQVSIHKAIHVDRIFGGTAALRSLLKGDSVDPALMPNLVFHEFGQQVHKIFGIGPLILDQIKNQTEIQPENRFTDRVEEQPKEQPKERSTLRLVG